MKASLVTTFAVRSLGRNVRRTLLSVIGVGIGCAVALFFSAFMRGSLELRIRSVAESGVGHVRLAPADWPISREHKLRLRHWQEELETVRSSQDVAVAVPRARAEALLAFGTRVAGVEMVGVDPLAEAQVNRLVGFIEEGRYLLAEDRGMIVIGGVIAERLDVELEDDLFLTVVNADGDMEYAMFRIVGIVNTGSRDIDASFCHVTLDDVEQLTGLEGAGEITLLLNDWRRIDRVTARMRQEMPEGDVVLTWKEVVPGIGGDTRSDQAFMDLFTGIVLAVVILGVTSAQLTAILERKREFAVLRALGMKSVQVIRLLLLEATAMGVLGAAVGLLLATPLVHYTATTGINFESVMGGELTMSGVLFDPVMYSDMGWWMVPYALIVALGSMLIAALYPSWSAIRTNPTSALSLREA
jgi:ABC-type lipoprotein release transport system permease subunit